MLLNGRIMKVRSPLAPMFLPFITFGLYQIYWLYTIAEDMRAITKGNFPSGTTVVLLSICTCGLYGIYFYYKLGEMLNEGCRFYDLPSNLSGGKCLALVLGVTLLDMMAGAFSIFFLTPLFFILSTALELVLLYLVQKEFNNLLTGIATRVTGRPYNKYETIII